MEDNKTYKTQSDSEKEKALKRSALKRLLKQGLRKEANGINNKEENRISKDAERKAKDSEVKRLTGGKSLKDLNDGEKRLVKNRLDKRKEFIKSSKERFEKILKSKGKSSDE